MATQAASASAAARPQLLVVDDEPNIRALLGRALAMSGHDVEEARSGAHAVALLESRAFDLMVVDLQMPDMDGVEVMQRGRLLHPEMLVIILTGHGSLESAMAAIKAGAVDYLLKPAGLHEIVSAVEQALKSRAGRLRRHQLLQQMSDTMDALRSLESAVGETRPREERFLAAGPFTLDRQKRLLIGSGEPAQTAELSEAEMAVLAVLMAQPDRVLSSREMAKRAWNYDLAEDEARNLLRQYIFRLRRKIEADPEHPRWIHTVRGRGYSFGDKAPSSLPG